ncbi:hypothetical protein AYI70_g7752 [Smittium culicis]|uniref:CCHC-type domain-containing protein n=1 Tax=Smittium culicis TaxID=133412 RepID=A0A1R1XJ53_9FUNG|nr:hypothetical protein AYI70_g7752 [Smittium culicis]
MFKAEIFPTKFKGDESDVGNVSLWIKKFDSAIKFTKVKEDDKVELFKLWLEDKAAIWQYEVEQDEDTASWTLTEWLGKTEKRFGKGKDKTSKRDIFELVKLEKLSSETMSEFNHRIKMFIKCMDETMYTETLLKKAYLDLISEVDNNIWWNLAQTSRDKTLDELMKMATTLDELKTSSNRKKRSEDIKESKAVKPQPEAEGKTQKMMDDLMIAMEKLTLLAQASRKTRDFSSVTCYTCGKSGHTSRICPESKPYKKTEPIDTSAKTMLALEDSEPEDAETALAFERIGNKRIRIEELLNRPRIQGTLLVGEEGKSEVEALCYFLASVNGQEVPVFIDSGARYSIIDKRLVKSLGILTVRLQTPIKIISVNGGEITEITEEIIIPLELEKGIIINIKFLVLENCAVYILMGIDACQNLKVNIDYKIETISFRHQKHKTTLQLMSKKNIIDSLEEYDSDMDFSDSSEESDIEEGTDDFESVHLMYAGIENEINEEGFPEIDDLEEVSSDNSYSIGNKLELKQEEEIKLLIKNYDEGFGDTHWLKKRLLI